MQNNSPVQSLQKGSFVLVELPEDGLSERRLTEVLQHDRPVQGRAALRDLSGQHDRHCAEQGAGDPTLPFDPRGSRRHESGDCAGAQHDEGVDDHADDDLNFAENESLSGRVSLPVIYELRDDRELHDSGLGVEQVGDEPHPEQLRPGVARVGLCLE